MLSTTVVWWHRILTADFESNSILLNLHRSIRSLWIRSYSFSYNRWWCILLELMDVCNPVELPRIAIIPIKVVITSLRSSAVCPPSHSYQVVLPYAIEKDLPMSIPSVVDWYKWSSKSKRISYPPHVQTRNQIFYRDISVNLMFLTPCSVLSGSAVLIFSFFRQRIIRKSAIPHCSLLTWVVWLKFIV